MATKAELEEELAKVRARLDELEGPMRAKQQATKRIAELCEEARGLMAAAAALAEANGLEFDPPSDLPRGVVSEDPWSSSGMGC